MTVLFSLFLHLVYRDHDVPQHQFSCFRIEIIFHCIFHMVKIRRFLIINHWKRQHIRRRIDLTVLFIDGLDGIIVCQNHIHLCLIRAFFKIKRRLYDLLYDLLIGKIQFFLCFILNGNCHYRLFPFRVFFTAGVFLSPLAVFDAVFFS